MKVFITGASGWIGSTVADELLAAGHALTGLARSDATAAALAAKGVDVLRGDLDDLAALRAGADAAEAVVHLARNHDWANIKDSDLAEYRAVDTIGETLAGSDRRFLLASGLFPVPGRPVTEQDASPVPAGPEQHRGGSESLAFGFVEHGVRVVSVRFAPSVHGVGDHGLLASIAAAARTNGVSLFPGDGSSAWSAVHRSDAGRVVRLALELAPAGTRVHAVGEEAVTKRQIAEALGVALGVPVESLPEDEATARLGFVGRFFAMDMRGANTATRGLLGWDPSGPTLLEDIAAGAYSG